MSICTPILTHTSIYTDGKEGGREREIGCVRCVMGGGWLGWWGRPSSAIDHLAYLSCTDMFCTPTVHNSVVPTLQVKTSSVRFHLINCP